MPGIHYIMAVWGRRYVDLMLEIVLPTVLSPGNLPASRWRAGSSFRFYTTAADAAQIRAAPILRRLEALLPVQFFIVAPEAEPDIAAENAYDAMSVFHRHAITAVPPGDFLVFLTADAIMSDGALPYLEARADAGADAVVVCGIRAAIEGAVPAIRAEFARHPEAPRLAARTMVDLLLAHPHPLQTAITWGGPRFNNLFPGHMYWRAGAGGILAHCWHLHPWMIRAVPGTEDFVTTIDADYVDLAVEKGLKMDVVADSDALCVVELSPAAYLDAVVRDARPFDLEIVLDWAYRACREIHLDFYRLPVVFKGTHYDPAAMARCQAEAAPVVAAIDRAVREERATVSELRDFGALTPADRVFIYGCGTFGRTIRTLLAAAGTAPVIGFIDSERDGTLDGLPVHSLARYRTMATPGAVILVCSMYYREIFARLRTLPGARVHTCITLFSAYRKRHLRTVPVLSWPDAAAASEGRR